MSDHLPPTGTAAANGFDHEPDRGLFAAAALPRRPHDARADRRGIVVAESPAGGCLSRSFAAHGRDHHPMARTRRRGSGAADHRAGRTRDERHSADDDDALDLALRIVRRHPHLSGRHGQLLRAPAGFQPAAGPQSAERRDPFGVAAVLAFGADLSLRAAKPGPVADGTQDLRGLDRRAPIQIRSRRGG